MARNFGPAAIVALLAVAPTLRAQDVTVSEPVWSSTDPAPDELPKYKKRFNPDYPAELRKTGELGYVMIDRYVDATGESQYLQLAGSHLPFQRSVEKEYEYWQMTPANRAGQPVNTAVWLSVIFNPRSASKDGPDAIPRLLEVWPVFVSNSSDRTEPTLVVPVHFQLDVTGAIMSAVPETKVAEKLGRAVADSLQHWKFAPARKNGQPMAAEITVPVVCLATPLSHPGKQVPPKPLKVVDPEYPISMRRFGLEGRVLVEFVIDSTGRVQDPVIIRSNNPAFDEPAIEALQRWSFQPATIGGRATNSRVRQDIIFNLEEGGRDAFRVTIKGDQEILPPELRFDTPPKIRGVQIPVYPYVQRANRVTGVVHANILVDQQGRVAGVKIISADQPEFGLATASALEGFVFDPALKDGKPVRALISYEQKFTPADLGDEPGDRCLAEEKKHPEKIVSGSALDAPPNPISRHRPIFPVTVKPETTTGSATIECLIDRRGRVRLPRIVEASEPAFGYAAMQALAAWWFEPPKVHGEPVIVRVRVPFDFVMKNPAAPADKAPTDSKPGNP